MESAVFEIIAYQPSHQSKFEQLNRTWIERHFWMEPVDFEVLQNPAVHIIDPGGSIFMVRFDGEIAGTVALKLITLGVYELTKMAVDDKYQGKKLGKALAQSAIEWARNRGATRVILYSNTKLVTAISLYRKLGFREIPVDGPYKRSDIKMELELTPKIKVL